MSNQPVILVTGASSGIGEATARLFGQQGYRLVIAARRLERLESLAEEIREGGGEALPVAADLSALDDINRLVRTSLQQFERVDILFNNAGFGRLDWLEKLDPVKDIEAQLRVNLLGVVQLSRAVLPFMIEQRRGHIINMGSLAGLVATPTYSVYAASKFAVRGFSEALRREVGVYGIRVSTIYPGSVRTEFEAHAGIKRKTGLGTPARLRLSSEQVAHTVLRVAQRPRRVTIVPWPMVFSVWLNSLFPGFMDWIIERRFVRLERDFT